jgi:two-component system response regulator FixJ
MATEGVVHIIDDDEAVRSSLAFLLGTVDIEVRAYESAVAFLEELRDLKDGCIVTDVRMPDIDGIELLRKVRAKGVALPVIVMTGHGDVPLAVEAMKLGATDFLEKPFDDEAMVAAVRAALDRTRERGEREERQTAILEKLAQLSPRERQVLEGLVAGQSNKTIAYDLGISPRTVEIYRANVMTKMQAGSLSDLIRMSLVAGPLPDSGSESA